MNDADGDALNYITQMPCNLRTKFWLLPHEIPMIELGAPPALAHCSITSERETNKKKDFLIIKKHSDMMTKLLVHRIISSGV